GRPFYAMRFIKGESLSHAIRRLHADEELQANPRKWALELRKLLGRFLVVCNAIAYAHSQGVLHRDLKPDNIMLGDYGEALVVDWGLARLMDKQKKSPAVADSLRPCEKVQDSALTLEGAILGTPAYMSPEQARGEVGSLGPVCDVYSLGATLYHLLAGKA